MMEQNNLKIVEYMELIADSEKSLIFEIYNNLETVVTLNNNEITRKLGKEDFEVVINRFINALETKEHKYMDHVIDGNKVFHICCLKPENYSITGKYSEDKFTVYVSEDDNYNMSIDTIEISKETKIKWLQELVILSLKLKQLKDQRRKKNRRKKRIDKIVLLFVKIGKLIRVKQE